LPFHPNLIATPDGALDILRAARRIAVLGIKPESQSGQPAFYVPSYLKAVGYEVIPVPVYYPDVTEILGATVYRRVAEIPAPPVDLVVVFRRPADLAGHVADLIDAAPGAVWFQTGIRDDAVALTLAEAGIRVVQDRCAMVDHRGIR
jgi:predicted CoA-binding protein